MPVGTLGATSTPGGSSAQIQYNLGGAFAGIVNSNVTTTGNVGLGTTLSANKLDVQGGVGIGTAYAGYTSAPSNGLIVQGNVGIGSTTPGQALDVQGTVRNIGELVNGNVGIGTSFVNGVGEGALTVMNGNVGIGTWVPAGALSVRVGAITGTIVPSINMGLANGGQYNPGITLSSNSSWTIFNNEAGNNDLSFSDGTHFPFAIYSTGVTVGGDTNNASTMDVKGNVTIGSLYFGTNSAPTNGMIVQGNVGISTTVPAGALDVEGTLSPIIFNAYAGTKNVGIGSLNPGQALDVQGTVRTTGFTLNLNPSSGYVMVGNSVGVGTWMPVGTLGATSTPGGSSAQIQYNLGGAFAGIVNSNVTASGNVGLGTTLSSNKLDVQGSVGIGTAYAGYTSAPSNGLIVQGNVGIGSTAPGQALDVQGTVRTSLGAIFNGNVGIGTMANQAALSVMNGNVGIGTYSPTALFQVAGVGNVGINSVTPGAALDINGGARMTGFTLTTSPVAGDILMTNSVGVGTWIPASSVASAGTPGGSSAQIQYNLGGAFAGIANSNVTASGNVGLGTTFSANKLDVQGSVGIGTAYAGYTSATANGLIVQGNVGVGTRFPETQFVLYATSPDLNVDDQSSTDEGAYFITNASGNSAKMAFTASGNVIPNALYFATKQANSPILFEPNLVEAMRIISGGNVGIGTSLPAGALDVEGTLFPVIFNAYANTKNVGIGSLTPGQALDVQGTVRMKGFTLNLNPSSGYVMVGNSVGVGTWMPVGTLGATSTPGGSSAQIQYNLGGAFAGIVNSNVTATGNVGLGTTLSANKLDVQGGVGIGTAYAGYTSAPANGLIVQGNVGIGSTAPGQALDIQGTVRNIGVIVNGNVGIGTSFVNGAGEGALSVMNGNVGIGTWVPKKLVDVEGALYTNVLDLANFTFSPSWGVGSTYLAGNGGGTAADFIQFGTNSIQRAVITGTGNVGISTTLPAGTLDVEGTLFPIIFNVDANTQNVGIGSLTPGQALDVQGTVRTTGFTLNLNPSSGYVMVGNSVGVGTWMPASTLSSSSTPGGSSAQIQYNLGGAFAGIVNSNVTASGNVGLGTTLSANKLDIQGAVGIGTAYAGYTAAPANGLIVQGNVGVGSTAPGQKLDVTGTVRDIGEIVNGNVGIGTSFVNGAGEGALTVMNGNVGIGTWLPAFPFQVVSTGHDMVSFLSSDTLGTAVHINATSAGGHEFELWSSANGQSNGGGNFYIQDDTGTVVRLIINSAGNVGISTTVPAGTLDVEGTLSPIIFNAYAGTKNVGIGSLTPGQALDVQGTVRMKGFTLNLNPSSGYVMVGNSIGVGTWMPVGTLGATSTPGGSSAQIQYNLGGAFAGIVNSNVTASGNVGLGTTLSTNTLDIQGAVGIGTAYAGYTSAPPNGLIVQGNVGIGSTAPGQKLDVTGTVRDIGEIVNGNVGIGTSFVNGAGEGALAVMNGNVGIGTWIPAGQLDVEGTLSKVIFGGNVGIGSNAPGQVLDINGAIRSTASGNSTFAGNVGIGSLAPGTALDVNGVGRMTGFTLNLNPSSGYVMVGNSIGVGTWMPVSTLGAGGTPGGSSAQIQYNLGGAFAGIVNSNVTASGNVGLGTTLSANKLDIQGSVGIGTAYAGYTSAPSNGLIVQGNVGIGSTAPGQKLDVNGTLRIFNGNVGISTTTSTGGLNLTVNSPDASWLTTSAGDGSLLVQGNQSQEEFLIGTNAGGTLALVEDGGSAVSSGEKIGKIAFAGVPDNLHATNFHESAFIFALSDQAFNATSMGTNLVIQTTPDNSIVPLERVRIAASGNVGINISAPAGTLDVEGTLFPIIFNANANTKNVGIGSLTPGQALDVQGTVRTTGFTLNLNPSSGYVMVGNSIGVGTWMPVGTLGAGGTPGGSSAQIQYNLGGAFAGIVNSNVTASGNVGLGTTLSANKLDVQGSVGIGTAYAGYTSAPVNGLIVQGNVGIGSTAPGQKLDVTGTVRDIGEIVNGNVGIGTSFVNGANEGALSVMNGNVGIGTWIPAGQLDVEGSVSVAYFGGKVGIGTVNPQNPLVVTDNGGNNIQAINTQNDGQFSGGEFVATQDDGAAVTAGARIFDFWISAAINGSHASNGGAKISAYADQLWSSSANGAVLVFGTTPDNTNNGPVERVRIASTGNVGIGTLLTGNQLTVLGNIGVGATAASSYLTTAAPGGGMIIEGNVGIGSLAPGQALDVQGTVRTKGFTLNLNPSSGYVMVGNSVGVGTWMSVSTLGATGSPGGSSAQIQYNLGGAFAGIANSNVTASGNVGLGTILSANKLDVQGSVGIGTAYAGYTSAPSNGLIVQGNVGIGSTVPGQALDVNGTVRVFNGNVGVGSASPGAAVDIQGNLRVSNGAGFNNFTTNVGINSLAPGAALDINGAARMTGFTLNLSPGSGYILMGNSIGVGTWIPASAVASPGTPGGSSAQIQYNLGGSFAGIINSNVTTTGNVGLGTTLSANKLDIQGAVGIGTAYAGYTSAPPNGLIVQGNVGIGSTAPGQTLDIQGTIRSIGAIHTGNVGIGTSFINGAGEGALTVMNGNVGIGTWVGAGALTVMNGNVGIGTWAANGAFIVQSGNVGIGLPNPSYLMQLKDAQTLGTQPTDLGFILGDSEATPRQGGFFFGGSSDFVSGSFSNHKMNFVSDNGSAVCETFGTDDSVSIQQTTCTVGGKTKFYIDTNGNIGLSTTTPANILSVNGSASFGAYATTAAPAGGIIASGNVGIGSAAPGQMLDVTGTARMTGFTLTGNGAAAGNVMVANSVGVGTWMPTNTLAAGTLTTETPNEVAYYTGNSTLSGAPVFQFNGTNVGIGTNAFNASLQVVGNIGIGTVANGDNFITNSPPKGGMIIEGNVGIGSTAPGQKLDMQGTVRDIGEIVNGDVGIGTSFVSGAGEAALTVMNGNVGIGTWIPHAQLDVEGTLSKASFLGNVGIGTTAANEPLFVYSTTDNSDSMDITATGIVNDFAFSVNVPAATSKAFGVSILGGGGFNTSVFFGDGTYAIGPGTSTRDIFLWRTGTSTLQIDSNKLGGVANVDVTGNVGIGTTANQAPLTVIGGNVGIGTWAPTALLEIAAGSTSTAPLQFNSSGTNLNAPAQAGAIEYDGTAFYATSAASSRQVIHAEQFMDLSATYTLLNQAPAQKALNAGLNGNGQLTVQASTMYFFEGQYLMTITNAVDLKLGFAVGGAGGATLTSINYTSLSFPVTAGNEATSTYSSYGASANLTDVTNAGKVGWCSTFQGVMRVNAGGTITPEIGFSGAPGVSQMNIDSYFRLWPVGSNTTTYQGDWT